MFHLKQKKDLCSDDDSRERTVFHQCSFSPYNFLLRTCRKWILVKFKSGDIQSSQMAMAEFLKRTRISNIFHIARPRHEIQFTKQKELEIDTQETIDSDS